MRRIWSLTIEKDKILGNRFIDSQFNYTPLLWMFFRKTLYSEIEKIHHKTSKVIYESRDIYDNLLVQGNTVSVQERHLSFFMTEYSLFRLTSWKLVSVIFYQIFIFSPTIDLWKLWKMFFISSKKIFSFSRHSNFCIFSSSFPYFPDLKGQMGVE